KHREHRYASTTDLIVDLERVRDGKPPLEARTKFRDGLLENLADGAQADDYNDGMHPAQMRHHQPAQGAAYPVWLAAVAGVEFIAIIMLILIIAFAK
ncbi:MAG: hypothetical protein KDA33_17160, partial [Phycisphaerales bacterium]|nr:hypothetical protein [Phycisphaerales bacterium]